MSKFSTDLTAGGPTGSALVARIAENDNVNKLVDDTAALAAGLSRGRVVKYSKATQQWASCDGTVKLAADDVVGIVEYVDPQNSALGQVRIAGVYTDPALATNTAYYCQANGTLGTTKTPLYMGVTTSAGRLCMPSSGSGGAALESTIPWRWRYFGDGCEGAFNSTGNVTMGGEHFFTDFTLNEGHALTIDPNVGCLIIRATGTVTIAGTINGVVNNAQFDAESSTVGNGFTTGKFGISGFGCGCGGRGNGRADGANPGLTRMPGASLLFGTSVVEQIGLIDSSSPAVGHETYRWNTSPAYYTSTFHNNVAANISILANTGSLSVAAIRKALLYCPVFYGSGGGNGNAQGTTPYQAGKGGRGGAGLLVVAKTIVFTGSITCAGEQGGAPNDSTYRGGGGGGGGGCIAFFANSITDTGTKNVSGGAASTGSYPGEAGSPGWTLNVLLGG